MDGYVSGSDLLLSVSGKCVGHCTKHETTYQSDTKERSVKPASTEKQGSAGLFKSKSVTGLKISVTASGLAYYSETETGVKTVLTGWYAGKSVELKAFHRESDTSPYLVGNFVIDSIKESSPAQDDVTYDISLSNDGAPSVFAPDNYEGVAEG